MGISDESASEVVKYYSEGFKITIVLSADEYVDVITALVQKISKSTQYVTSSLGKKEEIVMKEARNYYDKENGINDNVEGESSRRYMVIFLILIFF